MQSFQDLSKNKSENEEKIFSENQIENNQNPNRAKRKYACSKKMMLNRLERNSCHSNLENSMKINVNDLSNFSIGQAKSAYLNKSFDLINENNKTEAAESNIDNSFYASDNNTTNYFDLRRESSVCSNQINYKNVNLEVNNNNKNNKNNNYNNKGNLRNEFKNHRNSDISDANIHNRISFCDDNQKNDYADNFKSDNSNRKNNDNNNNNNNNRSSKVDGKCNKRSSNWNNRSKRHYEEIKNSENFLEFINCKIENYQKEMMEYLTDVKIDLEKSYKKFYEKVIKISADKARRITQVYTRDSKAGQMTSRLSKTNESQTANDPSSFAFNNQIESKSPSFSIGNSPLKAQEPNPQNINFTNNNNKNSNCNNTNNNSNNDSDNDNKNNFPLFNNKSENQIFYDFPNMQDNSANSPNISFTYGNNIYNNYNNNAFDDPNRMLSKELENLKNFANKYITERMDTMFELHENLKDSIKQNLSLLSNFLNDYDFNCLNPMQEFINANADEICNSWVLPKIKFEKLNLNCILKNDKIPKIFRNFLINEDSENKFNKYTIEKSASYELDKRILRRNSLFLEKLILQKLNSVSELEKVFGSEEIKILNFDKIKKLQFLESSLDYFQNLKRFKNTFKLEAKKSFFFNEIPQNLCENFSNLTKISFRKCKLNNSSVSILMSEFEKLTNLGEINFANNDITLFNYRGYANFKNLHTLILRKNKISKFYLKNKNLYPQLKIVDLCCNNISELPQVAELVEESRVMALISRNLCLHNNPKAYKEYLISLKSLLLQTENKLRKLDLSYLYYSFSNREEYHFKNICLNKNLLFNIKKLDLSFNNLYDEDLAQFFKTNRGFVNIKEISLKNNRLTESFFDILIDLELNDLYEYLETFDLSNNNINHYCLEAVFKAFQDNGNLKQIMLKNNPVENYFYLFFCQRLGNKQKSDKFMLFFDKLEKLKLEKRNCVLVLNYNSDLFQYFSNEAKEISSKFIKFEK
jgi:hypothetical protein